MSEHVVVVGGSVAATAFIERLREVDGDQRVTVIDPDPHAPYDRPPLSKHYLAEGDPSDIAVDWGGLDVEIVRAAAVSLDSRARSVSIRDEAGVRSIPYDRALIATGALPIRLPFEPPDTFTLRSAEDAHRLRAAVRHGQHVAIIGAGAIGVELASSLTARGVRVTLLDRAAGPLERLLAGHLSAELTAWLEAAGVDCRWGAGITSVACTNGGWLIELNGQPDLTPDLVVSAVGSRPAVGWLEESGVLTDGALLVDDVGAVLIDGQPSPTLFAVGDAASRRIGDRTTRTESWEAARLQASHVASYLAGVEPEPDPLPYFWTEVAGRKVQVVGVLDPAGTLRLEFENPERGALQYAVEGVEGTAWIGVNAQPRIARLRMGG